MDPMSLLVISTFRWNIEVVVDGFEEFFPVSNTSTLIEDKSTSGYLDIGTTRIQWGLSTGSLLRNVDLPKPFANTNYNVQLTGDAGTVSAPSDNGLRSGNVQLKTTSNFSIRSSSGTALGINWFAIGVKP